MLTTLLPNMDGGENAEKLGIVGSLAKSVMIQESSWWSFIPNGRICYNNLLAGHSTAQ